MSSDSLNVPKELTEKVNATTRALLGTNEQKPRCVALQGRIGHNVECTIYMRRPACCREFKPSFEDGTKNPRCDDARRGKGLRPLRPSDYPKT
jgi:Fe-S-cluster containining protein